MSVTRDDVARRAGVSPATVSYVINDGPRPVAQATRSRVLKAIEELGYKPSAVASNLRRQKTRTLGLIVPDTHNPYFSEVARGIERVAFENGYTVISCHSSYDVEMEMKYVDMLQIQRAAGIVWIPATDSPDVLQMLTDYGVPTVVIDREVHGEGVKTVVADNFQGGYIAVEHLINLGHRRVGFISRPVELSHSQGRMAGYRAALNDHDISYDPTLIVRGGFTLEDGYRAVKDLLALRDPPTAVFAYNDIMAIGALRGIRERRLSVPDDFSVVGFDDIAQAAFTCPALTTIYMPKFELGQRGAQVLIALVESKPVPEVYQDKMAVRLIKRESTGPAPNIER